MPVRPFLLALGLAALSAAAVGQTDGQRGSTPPGASRGESGPADGAIKGGAIEEGAGTSRLPSETAARCNQLAGSLREQCLRELGGAGAGGGRPPNAPPPSPVQRDPFLEPPPQNPRP
jgi:hypothetical protein